MLSLQTSNDDLCWLVGLCPRSRTASSIQGHSVLGWDGRSPAAPAVARSAPPVPHTGEQRGPLLAKDSNTSHTDTWDHPSCCGVGLPHRWLKGRIAEHCAARESGQSWAIFFRLFEVAQLILSQKNSTCLSHAVF